MAPHDLEPCAAIHTKMVHHVYNVIVHHALEHHHMYLITAVLAMAQLDWELGRIWEFKVIHLIEDVQTWYAQSASKLMQVNDTSIHRNFSVTYSRFIKDQNILRDLQVLTFQVRPKPLLINVLSVWTCDPTSQDDPYKISTTSHHLSSATLSTKQ